MPWETSHRRAELPANWQLLRIRVLRRDGYRCQARDSRGLPCGRPANQVDHIIAGRNDSLDNLQALCRWHHARKSSAEGNAARRRARTTANVSERHPGLIDPTEPL